MLYHPAIFRSGRVDNENSAESVVMWMDNRLGLISDDWQTARWTTAMLQKDQHDRAVKLHSGVLVLNDYQSEIMEVHETLVLSDLAEREDTDAVKQLIEDGAKVNAKRVSIA